ncbi:hypothetical protein, partial [Streptomyces sp. NPDC052127]
MSGNTRSSAQATATDYWRRRFAAPVPQPALPLDFPHPPRQEGAAPRARRAAASAATVDRVTG